MGVTGQILSPRGSLFNRAKIIGSVRLENVFSPTGVHHADWRRPGVGDEICPIRTEHPPVQVNANRLVRLPWGLFSPGIFFSPGVGELTGRR